MCHLFVKVRGTVSQLEQEDCILQQHWLILTSVYNTLVDTVERCPEDTCSPTQRARGVYPPSVNDAFPPNFAAQSVHKTLETSIEHRRHTLQTLGVRRNIALD